MTTSSLGLFGLRLMQRPWILTSNTQKSRNSMPPGSQLVRHAVECPLDNVYDTLLGDPQLGGYLYDEIPLSHCALSFQHQFKLAKGVAHASCQPMISIVMAEKLIIGGDAMESMATPQIRIEKLLTPAYIHYFPSGSSSQAVM